MTWFSPDDVAWTPASRQLIPVRLIVIGIVFVPAVAATAILAALVWSGMWWFTAGLLLLGAWCAWIGVRLVLAHGWAEREDDLLVKRGRLWRSVTVVPYGRMQYVEVSSGPIARAFGIATVQLHTASPGTDASLNGVPADDAARLRDRLTSRGEARLAGL
ncbi:PH domain-containing protein [Demequina sp. TTPB684]|uniref:PH domain-containing protein n=1 Tax=unclassified Demequina TaxID=2620311 RepID=UPI001CF1CBB1|nr:MULTISPECIES: PH domain-containing protein [unclassified Demequina]MCB2413350.1 PH domain-containing protein [Demequina sp. TTPB684]UPU87488.1 PH domain-containing protein [Demequina sp. TMPB413]